jgi:hypothetical protein
VELADLGEMIGHAWGVAVPSLEYRPVGFGSHHWVATDSQGLRHFVTVDELRSESRVGDEVSALGLHLRRALEAATDLRAFGCSFVVAPITTRAGDPFFQFGSYSVALYPFIEGRSFSGLCTYKRSACSCTAFVETDPLLVRVVVRLVHPQILNPRPLVCSAPGTAQRGREVL